MKLSWKKRICAAFLGVGLGLTTGASAPAQGYGPAQPYYPGYAPQPYGYQPPYNPYNPYAYPPQAYRPMMPANGYAMPGYGMAAPAYPYQLMSRSPVTMPAAPTAAAPANAVAAAPTTPQTPQAPATLPPSTQPTTQPETTPSTASPMTQAPTTSESGDLGAGSVATASSLGMQGRADAYNRFNLFDNMAALPTNRVWFANQYLNKFNAGAIGDPVLEQRRQVMLYRVGGEIMLGCNVSVAFQDQYIDSAGSPDSWGNPEIMVKWAICNDECSVVSLTFGYEPQVSSNLNELHERTSRFLPGLLFFQGYGDRLFLQGGFQGNISSNDAPTTIDYALSLGAWLYRDPRLDIAGRPIHDCTGSCHKVHWISGVIPQVEVLGKNVVSNSHGAALVTTPGTILYEGRNVVDVTVGGRILFTPYVSLGSAFSLPITGPDVRRGELTSSLNISF